MDISKYSQYWENKDQWYLVEMAPKSFAIHGNLDTGMNVSVVIENDDAYDAVIQMMIKSGSTILSMEEEEGAPLRVSQTSNLVELNDDAIQKMMQDIMSNLESENNSNSDDES